MNTNQRYPAARIRRRLLLRFAALAVLLWTRPVHAGFVVSVQLVTADAGSADNVLEVDLTNTASVHVNNDIVLAIAGFSFGISTGTSNMDFTSATESPNFPYIFAGDSFDSFFGSPLNSTFGQSLVAGDIAFPTNVIVGTGVTVGLGQVFFNVAPGTQAGKYTVALDPSVTTLTDSNGNNVPITLDNGTITVNAQGPSSAPEPSTLTLGTIGLLALAGGSWRRRKRSGMQK